LNGTGNRSDVSFVIKADAAGNSYVTGWSAKTSGEFDILTAKYNASGQLLWKAVYDAGGSNDLGRGMVLDLSHDAVYVVGWAGTSQVTLRYRAGSIDPAGTLVWAKTVATSSRPSFDDRDMGVDLDASGDIYICTNAQSGREWITIKQSAAAAPATPLWTRYYAPNPGTNAAANALRVYGGHLYVTGWAAVESPGGFGPKTDYPTGRTPASVAIGDLNGDGRPDLVAANATPARCRSSWATARAGSEPGPSSRPGPNPPRWRSGM
jgi:hypothetical protein